MERDIFPPEMFYAISPDGRWIAYYSNETGSWEIYVQSMNDSESQSGRIRISTDGGEGPVINVPGWSYDVSPEAGRFLVLVNAAMDQSPPEFAVMTNFFDYIRRLSPTEAK